MKYVKWLLFLLSIFGLIYIFLGIREPFWQVVSYQQAITQLPKEGQYLPYRLRTIIWGDWVIAKSLVERTLSWLWFDKFYGIIPISLLFALFHKKYLPVILTIIGMALITIESNPNPAYYLWFLLPGLLAIFIP